MNRPRLQPHRLRTGRAGSLWLRTFRAALPWLIPLLLIAAAFSAGLPLGGWRTVSGVLATTDPANRVPGFHPGLEPLSIDLLHWLPAAAIAAVIGVMIWAWRGSTSGYGLFAAGAGFWLSLLVELARWFKPGQMPDFRDPLIAAVVAACVWRLMRYLPDQPVTRLPRHGAWWLRSRVLVGFPLAVGGLGLLAGAACVVPALETLGYAPAQVAAIIQSLPEDHRGSARVMTNGITVALQRIGVTRWLGLANRLDHPPDLPLPSWAGAGAVYDGVLPPGNLRLVTSIDSLRSAIETAAPGDVILLQPGTYRLAGTYITIRRPGTATNPIVLRASRLGTVALESDLSEAIKVYAPFWRFENIVLRGVCTDDTACDNGFHIVGTAAGTILHNLRIEDFNAQIKINGENGDAPDGGRIEHTTLIDTHARNTDAPVTPIDLVAANDWVIEANLIADFVKARGNGVSYGAFAKGASRGTVFTRDTILCEWHLRGTRGQSIGLSFGGGGTGNDARRDLGRSGYEHADGVMNDNLIAFCSDDGIYINRSANSILRRNTLIGTSGIDVRYPESTAIVEANIVDGSIRVRDDGLLWGDDNLSGTLIGTYLGRNPVRALFADPARLDLRWAQSPAVVRAEPGIDLCGADWPPAAPPGAFDDFHACAQAGDTQ